jgi:hypothetical protein
MSGAEALVIQRQVAIQDIVRQKGPREFLPAGPWECENAESNPRAACPLKFCVDRNYFGASGAGAASGDGVAAGFIAL